MMNRTTTRISFALALTLCCGLIAMAYLFEIVMGLEPCPLCMIQRLFVAALGITYLIALIHGPKRWGHLLYGAIGTALSIGGALVALRQVWVQLHPQQTTLCAPGFTTLLERLPLTATLRVLLTGSGDCATVSWQWLGLSMPAWMIIIFGIFAVFNLWLIVRPSHNAT